MSNRPASLRRLHPQRGVSLVELMIAVTLGLMVLATLASVFANSSRSRTELDRVSRQIENGRFAMEILTGDIKLAGFYGELAVNAVTAGPPAPGAALPDPCSTDKNVWKSAMLIGVQAYDNGVGIPVCVPSIDLKAGTDVIVVRRASTCEAGVAGCAAAVANRPYLQVSKCSAAPLQETASIATTYVLDYGTGNPPYNLHKRDCVNWAPVRQYMVSIYYISTNNGQGEPIPTLTRMEFDGVQYTIVPLVEGIEELNVEWGIDNNNDGSPDIYSADPSAYTYTGCATCTSVENWQRVVTARVTLLARSTEASNNYTDQKTYTIGLDAAGIPITKTYNDAYRRHVYTSTVRIVNVSDRKDVP